MCADAMDPPQPKSGLPPEAEIAATTPKGGFGHQRRTLAGLTGWLRVTPAATLFRAAWSAPLTQKPWRPGKLSPGLIRIPSSTQCFDRPPCYEQSRCYIE